MSIIEFIREWIWGRESTRAEIYIPYNVKNDPLEYAKFRKDAFTANNKYMKDRVEFIQKRNKIQVLNEEIKNLQLSIAVAKKQKKKTSHFYAEMAKLQAEVLRMEAM